MEMVNINQWMSAETVNVRIAVCIKAASYELELRPFMPMEGDQLYQKWTDYNGFEKHHYVPNYAVANMDRAAKSMGRYVDDELAKYLLEFLEKRDLMFWNTFYAAFQWTASAPVSLLCKPMLLSYGLRKIDSCRASARYRLSPFVGGLSYDKSS